MVLHDTHHSHEKAPTCFILYNRHAPDSHKLEHFAQEIREHTHHKVELMDMTTHEGEKFRVFYGIDIKKLPAVLLITGEHTLSHHWFTPHIPSAHDIAHYLRQVSA